MTIVASTARMAGARATRRRTGRARAIGRDQRGDRQGSAGPDHVRGTSTDRISSARRSSATLPSTSASGVRMTRCRRAQGRDFLDVVGDGEVAAFQRGHRPGPPEDRHAGAGRGAERKRRPFAGLANERRDVIRIRSSTSTPGAAPLDLKHLAGTGYRPNSSVKSASGLEPARVQSENRRSPRGSTDNRRRA